MGYILRSSKPDGSVRLGVGLPIKKDIMFIPDGADESYDVDSEIRKRFPKVRYYSWGWLETTVPSTWKESFEKMRFIEAVERRIVEKSFEYSPKYMGHYCCKICNSNDHLATSNGSLVLTANNKIYIAPAGVLHYVKAHNYRPPDEVVELFLRN